MRMSACLGGLLVFHIDFAPLHRSLIHLVTGLVLLQLRSVNLGYNNLTGSLPTSWSSLKQVSTLCMFLHGRALAGHGYDVWLSQPQFSKYSKYITTMYLVCRAHIAAEHRCKR